MRTRSSRRGYGLETWLWKLYPLVQPAVPGLAEQALATLGSGMKLSSFTPGAYNSLAGMILPGRGCRVTGSMMVTGLPFWSTLLEKLPARSRSVGTVTYLAEKGCNCRWNSSLQKKNSLSLLRLIFGITTGPPIVQPWSLNRKRLRGRPSRLFFQLLAFMLSLRWYQYPLPWNWDVPLLVTTEICAPMARPYSAW